MDRPDSDLDVSVLHKDILYSNQYIYVITDCKEISMKIPIGLNL